MLLQEIQQRVHTRIVAATMAAAMGAEAEIPDEDEIRTQFDEWLYATPNKEDPEKLALLQGLGLRL